MSLCFGSVADANDIPNERDDLDAGRSDFCLAIEAHREEVEAVDEDEADGDPRRRVDTCDPVLNQHRNGSHFNGDRDGHIEPV